MTEFEGNHTLLKGSRNINIFFGGRARKSIEKKSFSLMARHLPPPPNPIRVQTFGRLYSKNQKTQSPESFWLFLNMKKCNVSPDRFAERGVKSAGQDILCILWTYLHLLWCIISILYLRCLNILQFGHRFQFLARTKFWGILTDVLFSRSILTIFDRPFYIARNRAPVSSRMIPNVWMRSTKHIE